MSFYTLFDTTALKDPTVCNSYEDHKLPLFTVKVGARTSIEDEKERSPYNMAVHI